MQNIKFRKLTTSLMLLVFINTIGSNLFKHSPNSSAIDRKNNLATIFNDRAEARSTGARTGGGSFRRSSPSNSSPIRSNPAPIQPNRTGGNNTIIAPIFIPGSGGYNNGYRSSSSSSDGSWLVFLIVILALAGTGYLIYRVLRATNVGVSELDNNKVTISKLQVGLLAEARVIQSQLTELSLDADTETPEGLLMLLQESAIALLRTPENWVYVSSSSQATTRDKAEDLFNSLSIAERTKFSTETLVNMNGRVRTSNNYKNDPDQAPAAYIVVTLLIGTEYDQPLFGQINSREALQNALEKIAGISGEALSVFELLWTPQTETDALTYDEMLSEYTDMVAI
ncbi:putative membrane protein [Synechococcus sp. PCC 7502]|uniref:DUF1517 domain-containing protein n=1 Tax=Synechococcus sp. PCC 7502 TaxID=1173263 RepID=UPI00029FDD3A|nr:DUF1517 domain-containing protein [Synechococcus sp. PCC 7502]AFY74354.1 putative membrane protein [Synechococcus sp. PCC 7502]